MTLKGQDTDRATSELAEREITDRVIGCFLRVYNTLDVGMLESVYRNALTIELARDGLRSRSEVPINVVYRGIDVGFFRMDLLVEEMIAVEVKATELLPPIAKRQLLNYLRVSRLDVGLLLHFGPKPAFHRFESPRLRA